ncbi:MAG: hypothetical protein LBN22_04970 [Clostridiales Family XIII bacterium]|jgi:hypothetical protein|nr:hypothetical protein [Clostridiales Family XIII bacterium]
MGYSRRVRKNIYKNIIGLTEDRIDKADVAITVLSRLSGVLIAIILPLFLISAITNVLVRIPDMYTYEFTQSNLHTEMRMDISDDNLAEYFSDFIAHKNDLSLNTAFQGVERNVFTVGDIHILTKARYALDVSLIAAIIMFILLVLCSLMLFVNNQKKILRYTSAACIPITLCYVAAYVALIAYTPIRDRLQLYVFRYSFTGDDSIPLLLTDNFYRLIAAIVAIASLIIVLFIRSFIKKRTVVKRMFDDLI